MPKHNIKKPVEPPVLHAFDGFEHGGLRSLRRASGWLALGACAGPWANFAGANPSGMTVQSGSASVVQSGSQLTVTASQNAVLNWQHFNIGQGQTTTFVQPSSASVVWDRILDQNPSQIFGNLNANGIVVLWNQSGFFFGPNSEVHVGGMVVTTAEFPRDPATSGGIWQFNGPPPLARIVNYGEMHCQSGGSLFLIAADIENHGVVSAPQGQVGLYAGQQVLITDQPDGRGLAAAVSLPAGSIDNTGKLIADAGTIALRAQVVNQNGLVQADSALEHNGVIELVAGGAVNLGSASVIQADGGASGASPGGSITIQAGQAFSDVKGSLIGVTGGVQGGVGGHVEISAPQIASIQSQVNGGAQGGFSGGTLSIDPNYITLSNGGTGSAGSGSVNANDPPGSLNLNVNTAFSGFSKITLQALYDITLAPSTTWNLNTSTGVNSPGSSLTLQAGRNIIFGDSSSLLAGPGWSVQMAAGADFKSPSSVVSGVGGIYLNGSANGSLTTGSGSIQTADGNIQLAAGKEVLIGTGFVGTSGGGNISITALSGNVDAGSGGNHSDGSTAYQWLRNGTYVPLTTQSLNNIGGISTIAGGNIIINAGGDISSYGPTSGTYGLGMGANVSLTAGGSVFGRFQVADGLGQINAGLNFGSDSSPASLSLINGGWTVNAGHDIILNEVLNPSGSFNDQSRVPFQYDYGQNSSVVLNGGNSVQLMGADPAHTSENPNKLPIYPPILDVTAGAGGVHLGNDVILFPSPLGSLSVTTTDGGPLYGGAPLTANDAPQLQPGAANFARLIVSDANTSDSSNFDNGHAQTPVHQATDGPSVQLNISGDVQNLYVQSPTESVINIGGNARNFSFYGQNLAAGDTTQINVAGDFLTRDPSTSVATGIVPNSAIFDPLDTTQPQLAASLTYNPATHQLTIQGVMTPAELSFLLNPNVQQLDSDGNRVFNSQGNPVLIPATYTSDTAALNQLYQLSQNIPPPQAYAGLQIGGPGNLNITARNMDLGVTDGIRSVGPLDNVSLANISVQGANISVALSGDLDMTSSQIASFNGGNITVSAGGVINVGVQQQFTSDDTPKGIYTGHGGNVSVTGGGNIEVNGSRIATYDGGDISVVSKNGDVDAGSGGESSFSIVTAQVDPVTGQVVQQNNSFFSSGIVAMTSPDSHAAVGNISVSAGQNILANSGGILQLGLDGVRPTGGQVNLIAGGNIVANLSGVVGENVSLKAGGSVEGLVVATQNIFIGSGQNANVTAIGGGSISINAAGSVSGNIIGGGNVSVSGGEISAAIASTGGGVATSGEAGGARIGSFNNVSAPVAQQTSQEADKSVAEPSPGLTGDLDDAKKRGDKAPTLVKSTGRVTVILPAAK